MRYEPYRTKMGIVNVLRTANPTASNEDRYPFVFEGREPYRTNFGAVRFAVPHQNWYGV